MSSLPATGAYTYDAMARPTRVSRSGIIDVDADGTESFGGLDILQYSYDDAGRVSQIDSDPDGADYYGRPGFPTSGSEYSWDAAGRMTADTGRDISLIKYDHRNLPKDIAFGDGRRINNYYDADGALIGSVTRTLAVRPTLNPGKTTVRTYAADRVWEDSKLLYSYFPGGYFDASGAVHYLHNDYQGSVVLVTDSAGTVEQRNTYYPYGEPHRTPAGQPILYGGKEHDPVTGEYNYDARRLFAPMLLMTTADPLASNTPQFSPYVFCAANPVKYIDMTGCTFTERGEKIVKLLEDEILQRIEKQNRTINKLNEKIASGKLSDKKRANAENKIANAQGVIDVMNTVQGEIDQLRGSTQVYDLAVDNKYSDPKNIQNEYAHTEERDGGTFNTSTGVFEISLASTKLGSIAHELKHAYQFENGQWCAKGLAKGKTHLNLNDITDEIEAFERGNLFGQSMDGLNSGTYKNLISHKCQIDQFDIRVTSNPDILQRIANHNNISFRYNGTTYIGR
ncbi:MAG: hypothetical protein K2L21_05740 [Muribaculaceae bacterium]|nr:hypothetical protein [Muribaculaceae bacterium]